MARRALLFAVVLLVSSLSVLAQRSVFDPTPHPQLPQSEQSRFGGLGHDLGSISGRVSSLAGTPLSDAQVQLRSMSGGAKSVSTYTDHTGMFAFEGVTAGTYEVVAFSGIYQASDRVEVNGTPVTTLLRVPVPDKPADGGSDTVSVAQYQVPEKARKQFLKAREAAAKLKIDEAQELLQRALEIYPNYADALTLRAVFELDRDEITAALHDTQQAIQSDGNYAMAYTVRASALNATGRFDDALQALANSERLAPDSWQNYYEEAKAYLGKSDYSSAVRQLDRAKSLASSDFPQMHMLRARALIGLNQYAGAAAEIEIFLQKSPNGPESEQARSMLAKINNRH
jgi:Flp pilus assembly protein TadD